VHPDDREALLRVFADPSVLRWWGDAEESLREALRPEQNATPFVVEVDGAVAGFIQCYEELEPMYRHAAIDIALHPDFAGRGFGPDAVHTLARYLFTERGHHRLTIDPAVANLRAIEAYRRVGFQPVGVMRRYERGPDGSWHDGLLMDLLAEELVSPR
jgi:aminoglycoside 6'-N-acetyltransferase